MSEAKRFIVPLLQMWDCTGQPPALPSEQVVVIASELDRVTAERDAALGREAALREELSAAQRGLANCKLALDAQTHNYGVTKLRLIGAEQRLTAADERWGELVSAVRSINRSPQYKVMAIDDDEPQYRQRKEWIDWVLGLCDSPLKPAEGGGDE